MPTPFRAVAPAQAERLTLLAEECSEISQAICKYLRHGDAAMLAHLEREVGDVMSALRLMYRAGDIRKDVVRRHRKAKAKARRPYLHHQE